MSTHNILKILLSFVYHPTLIVMISKGNEVIQKSSLYTLMQKCPQEVYTFSEGCTKILLLLEAPPSVLV